VDFRYAAFHDLKPGAQDLARRLASNCVSTDLIVAPNLTLKFAQSLCRTKSVSVRYFAVSGGDHFSIGKRSSRETVRWIVDRFAEKAALTDCQKL
jgi:hypothetical protein